MIPCMGSVVMGHSSVNTSNPFEAPGRIGGGCVVDGSFKNMVVRLGPQGSVWQSKTSSTRPATILRWSLPWDEPDEIYSCLVGFGWLNRVVEGGPSFDASCIYGGGQ